MRSYTAVSEELVGQHVDPIMGEGLHAHTWTVTTFYPVAPLRDGRALKVALRTLLDHLPDADGVLPWWSGEELAQHIAQLPRGLHRLPRHAGRRLRSDGLVVIHYHGTPITPAAVMLTLAGNCFCLRQLLDDAGKLIGVGDKRPSQGRFTVTGFELLED